MFSAFKRIQYYLSSVVKLLRIGADVGNIQVEHLSEKLHQHTQNQKCFSIFNYLWASKA